MGALFTLLLSKIAAVVAWIGALWVAIFVALWDLVRDAFVWVFDQALGVAVTAAASVNTGGITPSLSAWQQIPAEVLNILQLIGVGTAMTIIASAIGIRLVLQLIPFTRLGS